MLGEDLDVVDERAAGLDRVGHSEVEARPADGGEVVEQHLAHERVAEAEDVGPAGHLDEEPVHDRRLDQVEALGRIEAGGIGEEEEIDVAADHRGDRRAGRRSVRPVAASDDG